MSPKPCTRTARSPELHCPDSERSLPPAPMMGSLKFEQSSRASWYGHCTMNLPMTPLQPWQFHRMTSFSHYADGRTPTSASATYDRVDCMLASRALSDTGSHLPHFALTVHES